MRSIQVLILGFLAFLGTGSLQAEVPKWVDIAFPDRLAGGMEFDFGLATRPASSFYGGGLGFNIDFGLNVARLFDTKTVIAPFCSIEPSWGNRWRGTVIEDLNSGYTDIYDPMDSPQNEQETVDFWSLDQAVSTVMEPMLAGECEGSCFCFRYGAAIGLPWRYAPLFRAYGMITMIGVSSSNGASYTDGTSGPGSLYGPLIPGWGFNIELFRGLLFSSEPIGSAYTLCVRVGFDVCDLAGSTIVHADEIDGIRDVKLSEFVDDAFAEEYSKAWSLNLSVQLLSLR